MEQGTLVIAVTIEQQALPVEGARVTVSGGGETVRLKTDASGRTPRLGVRTPDRSAGLDPNSGVQPYALYDVLVEAEGYPPVQINGVQAFPGVEAILPVDFTSLLQGRGARTNSIEIDIPPNALESTEQRQPEAPQPMQRISLIWAMPLMMLMACSGQTEAQSP